MRKLLTFISAALILAASTTSFADVMDTATIAKIHAEVKTNFIEKCKSDMKGATEAMCMCLAEKTQTSLDDGALGKCTNDVAGGPCVSQAVSQAVLKSMTKENVTACAQQNAQPMTTTSTTAN